MYDNKENFGFEFEYVNVVEMKWDDSKMVNKRRRWEIEWGLKIE